MPDITILLSGIAVCFLAGVLGGLSGAGTGLVIAGFLAPIVGAPRVVSASGKIAEALGFALALERAGYPADAAAILMDVHTGEVISLVSLPDFDPNDRPTPLLEGDPGDSPLFNRAVQGVYELGSTFKIFAVAQALELRCGRPVG